MIALLVTPTVFNLPQNSTIKCPQVAQWSKKKKTNTFLPVQETLETPAGPVGREDPLEKEIATYCSVLAWRIPWTEEPGGLQSIQSHRVGHN